MKAIPLLVASLLVLCGTAFQAHAQVSNRPFGFQGGTSFGIGGWGSVGMSSAYRELTLERKLLGRPATNGTFIRGPDDTLVNVTRSSSQAFASGVAAPFFASSFNGFGGSLGGIGFGYSSGGGLGEYGPALARGVPAATVPIDGWIGQLNSLDAPAS
jgi:hypothetical protein